MAAQAESESESESESTKRKRKSKSDIFYRMSSLLVGCACRHGANCAVGAVLYHVGSR
jgi:hypothetical protein